ncbi:MAG: molybdopterin-binding protein, partial [Candidatus Promineifilaceae bacterium]
MERKIYLEDIPLDEAWAAFREALAAAGLWGPLPAETIPLDQALGRVTAGPVWARLSSPHYHASAMDGYALRAADTAGASETRPITLTLVPAGAAALDVGRPAQAVNTGQPLPAWADAVVMLEHVQSVSDPAGRPAIAIRAGLPPGQHVRPIGEDMVASELILAANQRLRPVDLGALAGAGHAAVSVYRRPRVAILPTGSELIPYQQAAAGGVWPGQIVEYNALVLAAQVQSWGGLASRLPITPDDPAALEAALEAAAGGHDLVLANAGSSAGGQDYTADAVASLGALLVHGVAVRPGHPVILGLLRPAAGDDAPTPVIGVPGYPVSAALTGEIFVEPLLARWQGRPAYQPEQVEAYMTRKVTSHTGDEDYVRMAVG